MCLPLPERKLIERIRAVSFRNTTSWRNIRVGIGDDCAVLAPPRYQELLVTTDLCVEGVHFQRKFDRARSVGHRCLARGLSDIAAMGGEPLAVFLSLALPSKLSQRWVNEFLEGFTQLARTHGVALAGGDTSSSPHAIVTDVIVFGSTERGQAILRSTAKPGDLIYVTGELGASAAVLELILKSKLTRGTANRKAFQAHFYPVPRLAIGKYLRENKIASSMIDISDGLSTDLGHICEQSGVSAQLEAAKIPISQLARGSREGLKLSLHGGDDYELLFTAPARRHLPGRIAGVRITQIGRIKKGKDGISLIDSQGKRLPLQSLGWQHFGESG